LSTTWLINTREISSTKSHEKHEEGKPQRFAFLHERNILHKVTRKNTKRGNNGALPSFALLRETLWTGFSGHERNILHTFTRKNTKRGNNAAQSHVALLPETL